MAKEITVNTDTLSSTIDEAQGYLDIITRDLGKMYETVKVLDTMWDGPANDAFNLQFANDEKDMRAICETIQKIIECHTFAKDSYNQCETAVESIVSAIKV